MGDTMTDTEAQPSDPSAAQPAPAPIAEPCDLDKLEQRPVAGFPTVTIWRSEFNALIGEVRSLREQLAKSCGSCHPCENWADETWRRAGRKPPAVATWEATLAELASFRGT